jgi:hypothetical protein
MKRSIVLIVVMIVSCILQATAGNPPTIKKEKADDVCFVKTLDKVYFGQDVKMGLLYTKIISIDGTISKIRTSEIKSYMHDNRMFELLPVLCEKYDTTCYAMLEYVTSRSGLKLYKYCCATNRNSRFGYFVFKNNRFYLRVDQDNAINILPFFGIELKSS